jgi:lipopolysaccharide transport system permease protein
MRSDECGIRFSRSSASNGYNKTQKYLTIQDTNPDGMKSIRSTICDILTTMQILNAQQKYYLDFLLAMTEKEIKARYKFAVLGFLWIVLNPLLQMIVMGFVFQFFVPVKVDNYFLFLFTGLLPWNFFSMTISKCTPSIVFERALIQKAKFPRESIILSIVLSNLFHFLIALGLLILALFFDKVIEGYSFLQLLQYFLRIGLIVLLIVWLLLLTTGLSLLSAALNVKYRDVNFVVQAVMPLWFYATPVVYTLQLLPESFNFIFYLNPMTAIIEYFRVVLLNLPPQSVQLSVWSSLLTIALVWLGWWYFKEESKFFDDWV